MACAPVTARLTLLAHLQAALIVLFACGSVWEQLLVVTRVKRPFSGGPPRLPLCSLDSHPATYLYVLENKYSGRYEHHLLYICTNVRSVSVWCFVIVSTDMMVEKISAISQYCALSRYGLGLY